MNVVMVPKGTMEDRDQTVGVMTRAFAGDPVARWFYPDERQYRSSFPSFVEAFAGKAFDYGTVHRALASVGAAMWFPPTPTRTRTR